MIARPCTLVACAFFIATPWVSAQAAEPHPPGIPEALRLKIQQSYPGTTILERRFLDKECGKSGGRTPGIVAADFNGDGIIDYAVILRKTQSRTDPKYGQVRDYLLVAFLSRPDGTFEDFKLDDYEQAETTVWFLTPIESGKLYDFESKSWVNLATPGFASIRCGGGSASYYWDGEKLRNAGGT